MITKNEILVLSKQHKLLPTTIQKDYVIGWLLRSISRQRIVSQWVFKGGTCLKKCYFNNYRFSEDLDFTVPRSHSISVSKLRLFLEEMITWIESNSGLVFPHNDWRIEEYKNLRGNISYQVKISYIGPLGGALNSLPRVKFDLTKDELVVSEPQLRGVYHDFSDVFEPIPKILCYSIEEILAEKTRALVERQGRARDVYDIVNISRNFGDKIDFEQVKAIVKEKFEYKKLVEPLVSELMEVVDTQVLRTNWEHQLSHQLVVLPDVEGYLGDLEGVVGKWLKVI